MTTIEAIDILSLTPEQIIERGQVETVRLLIERLRELERIADVEQHAKLVGELELAQKRVKELEAQDCRCKCCDFHRDQEGGAR